MIRFRKDTPRYWFMSNYYSCEFVMNGIRYKNAEAAFQSHKVPLEERKQFMPMSYDPIEIIPMTITRCCVASDAERKGEDKGAKKGVSIDESDDGAEKKTKDRMIGRRSIIRYGLYHMSIQINSAMAQRNGVTMDDVNLLIDALQHMFEEDMSSSRALTLRKLFVVEHTKPMGNAYRDTIERALAARLKQPNDAPTSYEDYEVTYHREMLPDEVKVTEYNYNSQSV